MKKILLLVYIAAILFMAGIQRVSADRFKFYSFGEFSYYDSLTNELYDPEPQWFDASLGSGIEYALTKKGNLSLFGEAELFTNMNDWSNFTFMPIHQKYYVSGGIWLQNFYLKAEHLCTHAIDVDDWDMRGGYTKFAIGFDTRRGR